MLLDYGDKTTILSSGKNESTSLMQTSMFEKPQRNTKPLMTASSRLSSIGKDKQVSALDPQEEINTKRSHYHSPDKLGIHHVLVNCDGALGDEAERQYEVSVLME